MKNKLFAIALFAATVAAVGLYPLYGALPASATSAQPRDTQTDSARLARQAAEIEVVFVLDTTGSMRGLIQAAKEKIWSIASSMTQAKNAPTIRIGLVAYRDRGDAYVTRVVDLSADLDSVYATLMDFQAAGGGDGPESVNQALHDALHKISWGRSGNAYQTIFLVGDAPPHMDYQDEIQYPEILSAARQQGIVVNTIQCGNLGDTRSKWQHIASLAAGDYFQVEQSGGAVAMSTPFDRKLADLSKELDATRMYYGDAETKRKQARKMDATEKLHDKASDASRARRAAFNVSESGKLNRVGEGDLVEDVISGRVKLEEVEAEKLPASISVMSPAGQLRAIQETAGKRKDLHSKIGELAEQRAEYLAKKVAEEGGARDSLDVQLYDSVRKQAKQKGLTYEADAPAY